MYQVWLGGRWGNGGGLGLGAGKETGGEAKLNYIMYTVGWLRKKG